MKKSIVIGVLAVFLMVMLGSCDPITTMEKPTAAEALTAACRTIWKEVNAGNTEFKGPDGYGTISTSLIADAANIDTRKLWTGKVTLNGVTVRMDGHQYTFNGSFALVMKLDVASVPGISLANPATLTTSQLQQTGTLLVFSSHTGLENINCNLVLDYSHRVDPSVPNQVDESAHVTGTVDGVPVTVGNIIYSN